MIDVIGLALALASAAPAPMVAPPPVFDEALQALAAGDRALAAKKFGAACAIAPVSPAACWNAGVLQREQGQYAAAAESFERYGAAVPPKANDGERRLFSGSDADVAADLRALRDLGVAAIDIDFGGRSTAAAVLEEMRRFRKAVIDKI